MEQDRKNRIRAYIEAHTDEMIEDICALCRIDSVKGEAKDGMPYGEGPYRALMAAKDLCERYGFATKEYADRVVSADLNSGERCLDILAHMDVVAPGDGWTVTGPFEPVTKDGTIFGRGSSDDKGPAVAALYAMRAVKELGYPVSKNCRLILGSDEECGSSDIQHYYAVEPEAPMTFSPDAEFPLINVEKGQFRGELTASVGKGEGNRRLISFVSGDTINIVPGKAEAVVAGFAEAEIRAALNAVMNEIDADYELSFEYDEEQSETVIFAEGAPAHASTPENGVNAGVILLQLLAQLPFDSEEMVTAIQGMARFFPFGDHHGAALKIDICDDLSGYTSVSPDIFRGDSSSLSVRFDARTSVAATEENTILAAKACAENAGFVFSFDFNPAHAVAEDTPFIHTLLSAYTEVTGKEGRCVASGGGTYVQGLQNGVACGAVGETTDTHMHGPDEFMLISELQDAAVIYALSICELCR